MLFDSTYARRFGSSESESESRIMLARGRREGEDGGDCVMETEPEFYGMERRLEMMVVRVTDYECISSSELYTYNGKFQCLCILPQ